MQTLMRWFVNNSLISFHYLQEAWERQCHEAGTPLGKFYATWRKLRDREMLHVISQKDTVFDITINDLIIVIHI